MREAMRNEDWYAGRRNNKHALARKTVRPAKWDAKYQNKQSGGESAPVTVYEPSEAENLGHIGILAGVNYPDFSILFDGTFLPSVAETEEQGSLLKQLVVGDNLIFERSGNNQIIKGITARHSQLSRLRTDSSRLSQANSEEHIFAANIDIAIIVASVVRPPFRTGLVDRYLVLCQYSGIKSLLCLTKTDLAPMPDVSMYKNADLPIIGVSNKTKEGIEDLMPYLEGKRCVLVGNSGVGKSSLINSLLKEELIPTNAVSEKSGRGRHTTSSTSLHLIDKDTMLIDTPGIRSLGLWNIDSKSLRLYYPEFADFSINCEFRDCTHSHEPKCGVKIAVEEGLISKERYYSYLRLLKDL